MGRSRTSSPAELLVTVRRDDPAPIHHQLERELRSAIRSGRLVPDSALPSTRTLAEELAISRGVVVEAYEQLVAEGYLVSSPGGATRVAPQAIEAAPARTGATARTAATPRPAYAIDFGYGRPDVSQFPRQAWLRSLRRVLTEAPNDRLGYLDGRGSPELHAALAGYLNRVRGTAADAARIVVCNGFAQALRLVLDVARARGATRVGAEDPGQRDTLLAARQHGLEIVPVRVDEDGIVVSALARTDPDVVVVTPAHHFPTGAVLSAERRAALVAWATERGRLILEDDYDAEYRYDREPIGALQGLAPEQVVYAGSASKTLAPGLRLGWLIAPAALVDPIAAAKAAVDRGSASLEQLAFADFLARGDFDRHLRRMRPIYRGRRDRLLDGLRDHLPELRPVGASAGLHVLAWLPDDIDETDLVARLAGLGLGIEGVSQYRIAATGGPGGLIFGYGALGEAAIEDGVRLIASTLAAARTVGAWAAAQSDRMP